MRMNCVLVPFAAAIVVGCVAAPSDPGAHELDEAADSALTPVTESDGAGEAAFVVIPTPSDPVIRSWRLNVLNPHEQPMPAAWAEARTRWGERPMWHTNVHVYANLRSPPTTSDRANWHIVWCIQGGVSCQPEPDQYICLYAWNSKTPTAPELHNCFSDLHSAESWVLDVLHERARQATNGAIAIGAWEAACVDMLPELLWEIWWGASQLQSSNQPLKPDVFEVVTSAPVEVDVLGNDGSKSHKLNSKLSAPTYYDTIAKINKTVTGVSLNADKTKLLVDIATEGLYTFKYQVTRGTASKAKAHVTIKACDAGRRWDDALARCTGQRTSPPGSEGAKCRADGTCNSDLVCLHDADLPPEGICGRCDLADAIVTDPELDSEDVTDLSRVEQRRVHLKDSCRNQSFLDTSGVLAIVDADVERPTQGSIFAPNRQPLIRVARFAKAGSHPLCKQVFNLSTPMTLADLAAKCEQ